MPRFICFQRSVPEEASSSGGSGGSSITDFQAAFSEWNDAYGDHLVDPGGPFGRAALAHQNGTTGDPRDGVNGLAGGYMMLTADDLDAAVAIARAFPGLVRSGSAVEVIEIREPG